MQTEEDMKKQPFYHKRTLEWLEAYTHGDTDHHSQGKNWDRHYGMTVGDLINQLAAYPPSQPIVIRRDVGWSGMCNFEIEVGEVVVRAAGGDDYTQSREAMKKGELDTKIVVALMCEGYSTENLEPHEIEEEYTEE